MRIAANRLLTGSSPPPAFRDLPLVPVELANVANVEVTGNTIRDARGIATPAIVQEGPCIEVHVRDNTIDR